MYGYNFEDNDDDDDDDYIDTDSLGDWRNFRRDLAMGSKNGDNDISDSNEDSKSSKDRTVTGNQKLLEKHSKELAEEYASGIWAHQTATVSAIERN